MEPENRQQEADCQEHQGASPCQQCGANTYQAFVKAALWAGGGLVAIDDIPARVCEGCGEQFYDEQTTQKIEQVIAAPTVGAKQTILVPVFSLAETEPATQELGEDQQSQEAFLCKYCRSHTDQGVVKSALWAAGGLVAIEDIPARVCEECGEQFYDDQTSRKIAELTESGFPAESATRQILAYVFSLAQREVAEKDGDPRKGACRNREAS